MKDLRIIIPSGSHYSVSVIHQQMEVSSLRLGRRQLTISDPDGQYANGSFDFYLESI